MPYKEDPSLYCNEVCFKDCESIGLVEESTRETIRANNAEAIL